MSPRLYENPSSSAASSPFSSMSGVIASDTVTTQDVDISGNYTMTVTVSMATLTIKLHTIETQEYWMKVKVSSIIPQLCHGSNN